MKHLELVRLCLLPRFSLDMSVSRKLCERIVENARIKSGPERVITPC